MAGNQPVNARDYNRELVDAAYSVLLELVNVLGEYRDGMAVVGGWVPELMIQNKSEPHVGSLDVDIALDHELITEAGYASLCKRLESAGYEPHSEQKFIFFRTVQLHDRAVRVQVDLLAGEYDGSGKSHRTQKVQDVNARKARGCDLVFSMYEERLIEGARPDGRKDAARVRIPSIAAFLVMKGMAMMDRSKAKDPYDIYYCLREYPGGINAVAEVFRPYMHNKLVQEGLRNIELKFATVDHVGPEAVADFEEINDTDERDLLRQDAVQRVAALMELLKASALE